MYQHTKLGFHNPVELWNLFCAFHLVVLIAFQEEDYQLVIKMVCSV